MDTRKIQPGDAAFLKDGADPFGAIRSVGDGRDGSPLIVYVENSGEFAVPRQAVADIHFGKVIFNHSALDSAIISAISHAHDAEDTAEG